MQLPYRLNQRQPVHSRHLEIREQQFNACSDCPNNLIGLESISRFDCLKARFPQDGVYRGSEKQFIVYDQNWHCATLATKRPIAAVMGWVDLLLLVVSVRPRG